MSQAEELLDSIAEDTYTAGAGDKERHIVIGMDRKITVPEELRTIAVQFDHNIETVTFDCPRYWDKHDMAGDGFVVYINYMRADGKVGMTLAENKVADDSDENIMHFDWVISKNATLVQGYLTFLVCIKKATADGKEENHWNSELSKEDLYVAEGLECETQVVWTDYPDIITQLLTRMEKCEAVLDMSWVYATDEAIAALEETKANRNGDTINAAQISADNLSASEATIGDLSVEGALTLPNSIDDLEETEVSAGYSSRQTAGGLSIVDDSFTEVKKIEGKTVKTTNLLPYPYRTTTADSNGVTFTSSEDGSISITGTNDGAEYSQIILAREFSLPVGTYYISGENIIVQITRVDGTVVYIANSSFVVNEGDILTQVYAQVDKLSTVNKTVYPMLNAGSTALPYTPYFSGLKHARINSIKSTGRNLLNIPEEFAFTCFKKIDNVILPRGTYTFSLGSYEQGGTANPVVVFQNTDTVSNEKACDASKGTQTFDLVGGNYTIQFYANGWSYPNSEGVTSTLCKVMVNLGAKALPYEPYKEDIFQLPETVELGRYDSIDVPARKKNVQTKTLVLTGEENWQAGVTATEAYRCGLYVTDNYWNADEKTVISNYYDSATNSELYGGLKSVASASNYIFIYDPDYATNDISLWKAHLAELYAAGRPLIVEYRLRNPVESDIDILAGYEAWNGGSEMIVQKGEGDIEDNSQWGAVPTITQSYMLNENPEEAATKGYVRNAVADKVDEELFESVMESLRETDDRHQTAIEGLETKARSFDISITNLENKVNDIDIGQLPEVRHNVSANTADIENLDSRVGILEQAEKATVYDVLVNIPSELQASGADYVLTGQQYADGTFNKFKNGDIVYVEGVNGYGEIVSPFTDQDTYEKLEEYLRTDNFVGINVIPNTDLASYMAERADGDTDVEIHYIRYDSVPSFALHAEHAAKADLAERATNADAAEDAERANYASSAGALSLPNYSQIAFDSTTGTAELPEYGTYELWVYNSLVSSTKCRFGIITVEQGTTITPEVPMTYVSEEKYRTIGMWWLKITDKKAQLYSTNFKNYTDQNGDGATIDVRFSQLISVDDDALGIGVTYYLCYRKISY